MPLDTGLDSAIAEARNRLSKDFEHPKLAALAAYDGITHILSAGVEELRQIRELLEQQAR